VTDRVADSTAEGSRRSPLPLPAVVAAGDRGAARPVRGESKVYLELGGQPMVARAVATLQRVPEISEVFVVGDADRLEAALRPLVPELRKPLRIVPQFRNLYENCWETYRRLLPGAGVAGRDPEADDLDRYVLYLSADIPFTTAEEISHFVRLGLDLDRDYALGLSTEASMQAFYPKTPGDPGIRMAYFNVREGRYRQNNLHLLRPGRLLNRHYIQDMYEHRYQRQLWPIVGLAWRLLRSHRGGVATLGYYLLLQLASLADRSGYRRLADRVRAHIPLPRLEQGVSALLGCRYRFVVTELGGAAVDIDNEHDYDAARERFDEWLHGQRAQAEELVGRVSLPPVAEDAGLQVLREGGRE
jgi:CTP:molybdopterin cytidylyltransferase MocA